MIFSSYISFALRPCRRCEEWRAERTQLRFLQATINQVYVECHHEFVLEIANFNHNLKIWCRSSFSSYLMRDNPLLIWIYSHVSVGYSCSAHFVSYIFGRFRWKFFSYAEANFQTYRKATQVNPTIHPAHIRKRPDSSIFAHSNIIRVPERKKSASVIASRSFTTPILSSVRCSNWDLLRRRSRHVHDRQFETIDSATANISQSSSYLYSKTTSISSIAVCTKVVSSSRRSKMV